MHLNMDCVRDILFCVEEHTGIRSRCQFIDSGESQAADFLGLEINIPTYQLELLEKYNNDELIYHICYCIKANLIEGDDTSNGYDIFINDLTPSGHEFLANIRENNNWATVKKVAGKVGSTSLSAFTTIASQVIATLIKNELKFIL